MMLFYSSIRHVSLTKSNKSLQYYRIPKSYSRTKKTVRVVVVEMIVFHFTIVAVLLSNRKEVEIHAYHH
jgi:hypothetical protein